MILLDTNVLSEARHPKGSARVRKWVSEVDRETTFLSVISLFEIARGAAQLPDSRRRSEFLDWLNETKMRFADRILPIDAQISEWCGQRQGMMRQTGVQFGLSDGLIAATARIHGLRVATRNIRHMLAAGASAYDPWADEMHEPTP